MQSLMSADTGYSSPGQINIPKMSNLVRESLGMKVVNLLEWNTHCSALGRRTGVGSLVSVTCWVERCLKRKE